MFNSFNSYTGDLGASMSGLRAAVACAIAYAAGLDQSSITVTASDGSIILEGFASSYEAMLSAVQVAEDVAGGHVRNHLMTA
jgi:osmotically-inducible protein OsmY